MKKLKKELFLPSKEEDVSFSPLRWDQNTIINPVANFIQYACGYDHDLRYMSWHSFKQILDQADKSGFLDSFHSTMVSIEKEFQFIPFKKSQFILAIGEGANLLYIDQSPAHFIAVTYYLDGDTIVITQALYSDANSFSKEGHHFYYSSIEDNVLVKDMNDCLMQAKMIAGILSYFEYDEIRISPFSSKKLQGCRYQNNSKKEVTVINIDWVRNLKIIQSIGVRGHFRNQACGEGFKERKLTWISDHIRNYQKKAKTSSL